MLVQKPVRAGVLDRRELEAAQQRKEE
uniref:Uncharacterized protein n=1 Tax=Arundo donax TaxID=35708 RepID=A0A0A9FG32_ARUDO